MINLQKKYGNWALITGASSGIGKAFCYSLVQQGFNCIILSNDSIELEKTQAELQLINSTVEIIRKNIDLSDVELVQRFLQDDCLSTVRILVNCAGVGKINDFLNEGLESYLDLINLNAISPFVLSYCFAKKLYSHNLAGAIINISSANAEIRYPTPYSSVYTPLKCFLKNFTESIAIEMKHHKIDVINVSCGPTDTGFQQHANTKKLPWCETPEQVVKKTFRALGHKVSVTTNPVSRVLLGVLHYLPFTKNYKARLLGYYFGSLLGSIRSRPR